MPIIFKFANIVNVYIFLKKLYKKHVCLIFRFYFRIYLKKHINFNIHQTYILL